jgi:pyruvate/2-oxoacid:ferredoxin oxidoreductase beta subunit
VATATVDDFRDLQLKIRKALTIEGPKYIHILAPCPLGWGHHGELTVEICRLAKDTGLFPVYEIVDGKVTNSGGGRIFETARKVQASLQERGAKQRSGCNPRDRQPEHREV